MTIIELDGFPVERTVVDYLMLAPGETARIIPNQKKSGTSSAFWIHVGESGSVMGKGIHASPWKPRKSRAILRYFSNTDVPNVDMSDDPDAVIGNVPWLNSTVNEKVLPWDQINPSYPYLPLPNGYFPAADDELQPNFQRLSVNVNFYSGPAFNGFAFVFPTVPFSTQGISKMTKCNKKCSAQFASDCYCTNTVDINLGNIIEIVFTSYTNSEIDRYYHPMHIHGNSFFVVATGHGTYLPDKSPGADPTLNNPAFKCTEPDCAQTEPTGENIEYNFQDPVKRSTVLVPSGGFVVIRFKADNPGIWLLQCSTMSHILEGQTMLLNVTNQGIPPVPVNFPTCPIHTKSDSMENLPLINIGSIGANQYAPSSDINCNLNIILILFCILKYVFSTNIQ